ncbi:sugar transferase [Planosporangium thailandense]|uniref:sugar transferase n=1 Tax=Planosporangium thailandense TaxID=765197 RepID=UPI00197CA2A7|nr:sugar transferase [Planosporangium thailandense]
MSQDLFADTSRSVPAPRSAGAVFTELPPERPPSSRQRDRRPVDRATRLIDLVVASLLLIVLAPVMLLIAVLVRATSPGPALFKQTRVGCRRQPFVMLKFRTMAANCGDDVHRDFVCRMLRGEDPRHDSGAGLYKLEDDQRVTPLGRFLRATSLDELPQLINVVRGDMALVGPRPALAWEVELFQPHHHERFMVKPGMTGLWQVSGRCRLTMSAALDLDVTYVRRRSLTFDLWILMKTIPAVLSRRATR